jgi:hypothetical protein
MNMQWSTIQSVLAGVMFTLGFSKLFWGWYQKRRAQARERRVALERVTVALRAGEMDRATRIWRDAHGGSLVDARRAVEQLGINASGT